MKTNNANYELLSKSHKQTDSKLESISEALKKLDSAQNVFNENLHSEVAEAKNKVGTLEKDVSNLYQLA